MSCTCIQGEMPAPLRHFMCFTNQKPIQVKALLVYERERQKDQLHHLGFLLADACGSTHHLLPLWIFAQHPYTHPTLFQASVGLLYRWICTWVHTWACRIGSNCYHFIKNSGHILVHYLPPPTLPLLVSCCFFSLVSWDIAIFMCKHQCMCPSYPFCKLFIRVKYFVNFCCRNIFVKVVEIH